MSAAEPSRLTFVDVTFAPEARAIVTIVTSPQHPLCPNGVVAGPLTLEATQGLFSAQVLQRVEHALARMGRARTSPWEERKQGFVAWTDIDAALWPLADRDEVLDLVDAGVLP